MNRFTKDRRRQDGLYPICKDCRKAYSAKRYAENKELFNRRNAAWYEANREKRLAAMRRARSTPEFRRKNILIAARRRARKKQADDKDITLEALDRMLVEQNNRCPLCDESFLFVQKHLDHIIPLAKGGRHSIANVQFLCARCNYKKWCH